ncbi:MAG TPA: riboflavin synthase [Steroidobacteraceae bacterium]|nr:riboflavin synthase [Steroidobacteraceae bacterium]
MFTGIVLDVGRIEAREARGGDLRLTIGFTRFDAGRVAVGDSVCVQGCCLTAAAVGGTSFAADVSRETLALTTLGELAVGAPVNLEPSLRAADALGGHLVSGHVDGVARVVAVTAEARSMRLKIEVPAELARYIARKGSIAVDGVSLTVNEVEGAVFGVNLIPHTLSVTSLGSVSVGTRVNLEVDLLARYVERMLSGSVQR